MKLLILFLIIIFNCVACNSGVLTKEKNMKAIAEMDKLKKYPDSLLTRISIQSRDKYFEVKKGDIINDSIIIENIGTKDLKIESMTSQCDCTTIDFNSNKNISPSSKMVVHYSIKTDDIAYGYNQRTINMVGNFFPYFKNVSIILYISK